ncbi:hypothetical protein HGA34_02990 [Candidatus Falkowbacteria bacterium]|nr:hypothetical protein [Candidatus Falkowbacteria bacterium]
MKRRLINNVIAFLFLSFLAFAPSLVLGANLKDAFGTTDSTSGDGRTPLDEVADKSGYNIETENESLDPIIATIIQTALEFIGVIFLLLIIYGGYNWMTAAGDSGKVDTAKNTITRATIGLIVVLAAYAISYFVVRTLAEKTLKGDIQ